MKCPKCHIDMEKVMDEAVGMWWRCPECKMEVIRPLQEEPWAG
jgi:ribosomal protein L37AE/L43A